MRFQAGFIMIEARLDQKIKFGTLWSEIFNKVRGYVYIAKQRSLLRDKGYTLIKQN